MFIQSTGVTNHLAEIRRLTAILGDEAAGRPFDADEAVRLAEMLASACPDVAHSMRGIVARIDAARLESAA
jgi:hypothetical protein